MCDVVSTNTVNRATARPRCATRRRVVHYPRDGDRQDSHDSVHGDVIPADVQRRLTVAVCWALARRGALDSRELYEESFSLTEEFREWLLCLEERPDLLGETILMVPRQLEVDHKPGTDGLLEI